MPRLPVCVQEMCCIAFNLACAIVMARELRPLLVLQEAKQITGPAKVEESEYMVTLTRLERIEHLTRRGITETTMVGDENLWPTDTD